MFHISVIEPLRREGREEGFFVGFVVILEERFRIRTHQALSGGNRIDPRVVKGGRPSVSQFPVWVGSPQQPFNIIRKRSNAT